MLITYLKSPESCSEQNCSTCKVFTTRHTNTEVMELTNQLRQRGVAIVLALIMVLSMTAGVAVADTTDTEDWLDEGLDEADEIYIDDNGDVVLVYHDEDADIDELEMGGHVSEGLLYLFMADEPDAADQDELDGVEAHVSALLEGDEFSADGELTMPQPDELESLDAHVSGEFTDTVSQADASLDMTIVEDTAYPGFIGDVDSTGTMTFGYDTFAVDADLAMDTGAEPAPDTTLYDISIDDTPSGYSADVTEEKAVWSDDQWADEQTAVETLQGMYGGAAAEFGGEADVTLHHYDLEERDDGTYWLELDYSVDMHNIEDGLSEYVTMAVLDDSGFDVTEQQAEELGDAVTEINLDSFDVMYATDGASITADVDVEVSGFSDFVFTALDIAEDEIDDEVGADEFEEVSDVYEAHAAAGTTHTVDWDASVSADFDQAAEEMTMMVDVDVSYEADNWAAFVDEMTDRGMETGADVMFTFSATDSAGELEVDGEITVQDEALIEESLEELGELAMAEDDSEFAEFIETLQDGGLEVAKIDMSLTESEVTVEAGAQFDDLHALFPEDADVVPDHFLAQDENSASMYVHASGVVDDPDSLSESDLQSLDVVGDDTDVNMPGEWDRDFPEFDAEGAADYLGVDFSDGAGGAVPSDDSIPGFGVAVALVALLVAGGAFYRRRS